MRCPKCGKSYVKCPECGKRYPHGTQSHCDNTDWCKEVNAPLDCVGCGRVVSQDLHGVLDFDMSLIEY